MVLRLPGVDHTTLPVASSRYQLGQVQNIVDIDSISPREQASSARQERISARVGNGTVTWHGMTRKRWPKSDIAPVSSVNKVSHGGVD